MAKRKSKSKSSRPAHCAGFKKGTRQLKKGFKWPRSKSGCPVKAKARK
jgi:hypothetical protein